MQALVSVIIPVFNAEKYIVQTIESVIGQSYTNWELIVVNDGSTDNSKKLIEDLAASNPKIKLISKSNTGVSDTRNTGIDMAKGDYIAFLDADDVWLSDNLEKKVKVLENNRGIHYVFSQMLQADAALQNQSPAPKGKDTNILEDLLLWNGEVIPGPCSNLVVKRECFDSGIRFDKRLTTIADQNLCVQLAAKYKGKLIDEFLWIYRVIPGSMSKSLMVMEKDSLATYAIYLENNYFRSAAFRRKCFSNMYLILSGSWIKDGKNFLKGLKFFNLAFLQSPSNAIGKLARKLTGA